MPVGIDIGLERVLAATGGTVVKAGATRFSAVVIDGREPPRGALFFAIAGEHHDGHDFVGQATAAGADGVVVQRGRGQGLVGVASATVIEVDDTIQALGALGRAHRLAQPDLKVVGITGSNGKTTTKELIASIFAAALGPAHVLKTEGNLNNHLGVPLTLLRLLPSHRVAVVEMGMSGLGEIAYLSDLARPDVAVVVSIAPVHLEQLGTVENIARAKAEIVVGLQPDGVAVLPIDEPRLVPHVAHLPEERRLTFGPRSANPTVGYEDVSADLDGLALRLHLHGVTSRTGVLARVSLLGAHNASNAAAAAAAALALGVGEGSILEGLARVKAAKHRAQRLPVGDRTVLDDCYNASPLSMRAAVDTLVAVTPPDAKRVAVLGDMLELGPTSKALHEAVGRHAAAHADCVIGIGGQARFLVDAARETLGERALHTDDPRDAAEQAFELAGRGGVILVKASRGMRLERVIEALIEHAKGTPPIEEEN